MFRMKAVFSVSAAVILGLMVSSVARAEFEAYNPTKGYCGPGDWSIPHLVSVFNKACYGHDKCYNQCKNTKNTKAYCDDEFYREMKNKCDDARKQRYDECKKLSTKAAQNACLYASEASSKECMAAAKAHYEAVKRGADKFHSYNCTAADLKTSLPEVNLKVNGSDGPLTVPYNSKVTITWKGRYFAYCTASGAWSGEKKTTTGSVTTGLLTSSGTFTLTCKNSAGDSATDSVQVNVKAPGTGGGGTSVGSGPGTGVGTQRHK